MARRFKTTLLSLAMALAVGTTTPQPSAAAGIPVIDVAAIAQLIQQIAYWKQQIEGMTNQIKAITGTRGMQKLMPLSDLARNYLPPEYAEMMRVIQGRSITYYGLAEQIRAIIKANTILNSSDISALPPHQRNIVLQGREAAAMLQMVTQQAQQNTSKRFAAMQQLISAIGAAGDSKAIQDLQGRIQAEQAMLTTEQTKLQALYQMAQAQELQKAQLARESALHQLGRQASLAPLAW